ncbi:serine/threonine protein kinase [Pseudonocardia hierapolitana]|uniref:non-specific serine/threonine protein kinase n=1 Tax=Pseudonocardia hierapolitana TaxID=1128676 RepID=A0A561SMM4_9PSEU|nr:serine/threonine-protein kinase [Pseudonocardia hierapolitana]TWF76117.1 serine/threonine protein kinase [Pseudonocardia hierapolitana]
MTGIPDGAPVAVVAGRYRLRELVGTGGMGAVWRAGDELLGREVALKRVRLADQPATDIALARERIMREARIAAALHHPHIVSIFDVVLEDGEPWLVLEFLPSRSLGSVLTERGTLPPAEVAAIGADVAAALAAAHAAGIVHRDVKPDNVLLSRPSAAGPVVKLTDFGIAHTAASPAITATHVLTGTPAYFAPETARGEGTDTRSDVYSLGATLYAAVEGHPPFGSDPENVLALLARIGRGGAPLPQHAGPLTDLLRHLTADDPAARPTAAQAQAALRMIAGGGPPAGPPPAGLDAVLTGKRPRRGPRVAGAVVATLVVVAGVIAAVAVSRPGTGPSGPSSTPPTTTTASGTATIANPDTADPCSLLDAESVKGFGAVSVDPDNVLFAGCRADIARPDGGAVGFTVAFESQAETKQIAGASRSEESGYPIMRYPSGDDYCEQRIGLGDGNAVLVSAVEYEDPSGTTDLCAIAEAGRAAALSRLVNQGIGERQPLSATSPLAGIPACGLLTREEIVAALGDPSPEQPHFGGWGCNWNDYGLGDRVGLTYYRGFALGESDGTPAEFAGHQGAVLAREGNCWVQFVQRSYTARGSDRVEAVWVTYWGSGSGDELCRTATTLATAAAGRLPPPS